MAQAIPPPERDRLTIGHLPTIFNGSADLYQKNQNQLFSIKLYLRYVNTSGLRIEIAINFLGHSSAAMALDPAGKARIVTSEELSAWFNERVDQLTQDKRWLDAKALVREFFLQGPSCP